MKELLTIGFLFRFAIAGLVLLVWRSASGKDGFRPHPLERGGGVLLLAEGVHAWGALIAAQFIDPAVATRWFSFVPTQVAFLCLFAGGFLRARRDASNGQLTMRDVLPTLLIGANLVFFLLL